MSSDLLTTALLLKRSVEDSVCVQHPLKVQRVSYQKKKRKKKTICTGWFQYSRSSGVPSLSLLCVHLFRVASVLFLTLYHFLSTPPLPLFSYGFSRDYHETFFIRAALQRMLQDVEKVKSGEPENPPRTYANWRARSIIKEIAALQSPDALIEFEKELRDVLYFQEIRRRTKLINEYMYGECNLMEKLQLEQHEKEGRAAIEAEWHRVILCGMQVCRFMWDEELMRRQVLLERRSTIRVVRQLSDVSEVRVEEALQRQGVIAAERLALEELRQRRLMEVGQEIHYELLRQTLMSTFAKLHRYATDFIKDYKALFRAEERDRIAIEKISFLSFGVLMNEAERGLVQVLRQDIVTCAQQKAQTDKEEEAVLIARDIQQLFNHESQVRAIVVEKEQDEWHHLWEHYVVGWREVYHKITQTTDVVTMVSALELFERRYIYDQYRHGIYGIQSVFETEHRTAQFRQRKLFQVYDGYTAGAMALWQQENLQFNELRERYSRFLVAARAIQISKVLLLEEEMQRRQLMGEEVRQLVYLKRFCMRDKCKAEAMETAQMIMMHENSSREHIMYHFQQQCLLIPQEDLRRSEYLARIPIETEENIAYVDLHLYFEQLQHAETVQTVAATLGTKEEACRARLVSNEVEIRQHLIVEFFLSEERHARRTVRRNERFHCACLAMAALSSEDLYFREQMLQLHRTAITAAKLELVVSSEETERRVIQQEEKKRRDFLVASVPYEHLFLRACEVDELTHRLHIINEAELIIRACAYTFGHDAPVEYCNPDLRLQQAQLHFQSLSELLQEYERQLIQEVEPMRRQALEDEWSSGFLHHKTIFEEGRCRLHIYSKESSDWWAFSMLSSRMLERQHEFEARLVPREARPTLSHREELLRYLQQQSPEALQASILRKRQAIRGGLSVLMEELYWSRDTVLREEAVERRGLSLAFKKLAEVAREQAKKHQTREEEEEEDIEVSTDAGASPVAGPLSLHSVVVLNASDEQRVVALQLRHSDELEQRRIPLRPYRFINVAGKRMEVVVPTLSLPWLPEDAPYQGVVYFTLLGNSDQILATGSHLLQSQDKALTTVSVELDAGQGRLHLARHGCCPE
eukprot:gene4909-3521_t